MGGPFSPTPEVLNSPQYLALTQYLSIGKSHLDITLFAFCRPIEDKWASGTTQTSFEDILWVAWQAVVSIAAWIPHGSTSREMLAAFLVRLAYRPHQTADGKTCEIDDGVLWRDLPVLGWELRESWDVAPNNDEDQYANDQWINLNAFVATTVVAINSNAKNRPDFSLFCIWTVRTALEEEEKPTEGAIAAAAVWFKYASPVIFKFCKVSKEFEGKLAAPGSRFKEKEWKGFSEDRWNTWKQRLTDLWGSILRGDKAMLAQEALSAMLAAAKT